MNCAAMPENLVENELFGHEKGAFTGASTRSVGYFEQANRGTLFLDEISAMPMSQQAKLLRALQEGTVRRVGSGTDVKVDARVIAAMNVDPSQAMMDGRLRSDLFYRLSVFAIEVPPLRERPGDALLLARHFASEFARAQDRPPLRIDPEAARALAGIHGPATSASCETRSSAASFSPRTIESRSTSFLRRSLGRLRPSQGARSRPRPPCPRPTRGPRHDRRGGQAQAHRQDPRRHREHQRGCPQARHQLAHDLQQDARVEPLSRELLEQESLSGNAFAARSEVGNVEDLSRAISTSGFDLRRVRSVQADPEVRETVETRRDRAQTVVFLDTIEERSSVRRARLISPFLSSNRIASRKRN